MIGPHVNIMQSALVHSRNVLALFFPARVSAVRNDHLDQFEVSVSVNCVSIVRLLCAPSADSLRHWGKTRVRWILHLAATAD